MSEYVCGTVMPSVSRWTMLDVATSNAIPHWSQMPSSSPLTFSSMMRWIRSGGSRSKSQSLPPIARFVDDDDVLHPLLAVITLLRELNHAVPDPLHVFGNVDDGFSRMIQILKDKFTHIPFFVADMDGPARFRIQVDVFRKNDARHFRHGLQEGRASLSEPEKEHVCD